MRLAIVSAVTLDSIRTAVGLALGCIPLSPLSFWNPLYLVGRFKGIHKTQKSHCYIVGAYILVRIEAPSSI